MVNLVSKAQMDNLGRESISLDPSELASGLYAEIFSTIFTNRFTKAIQLGNLQQTQSPILRADTLGLDLGSAAVPKPPPPRLPHRPPG
jgi:hypothetical protein